MEKITRIQALIIALALAVGGALLWQTLRENAPATVTINNPQPSSGSEATAADAADEEGELDASAPSDTSDAGLDQDLAAIDSQLEQLDADATSIDSGLNDQPIAQE